MLFPIDNPQFHRGGIYVILYVQVYLCVSLGSCQRGVVLSFGNLGVPMVNPALGFAKQHAAHGCEARQARLNKKKKR